MFGFMLYIVCVRMCVTSKSVTLPQTMCRIRDPLIKQLFTFCYHTRFFFLFNPSILCDMLTLSMPRVMAYQFDDNTLLLCDAATVVVFVKIMFLFIFHFFMPSLFRFLFTVSFHIHSLSHSSFHSLIHSFFKYLFSHPSESPIDKVWK